MKMTMIDLQGTLERLRAEKYPELKPELIAEIVKIQSNFMEDQTEAYRRISQVLESYLQLEGASTTC
jgi:hypothetical protein